MRSVEALIDRCRGSVTTSYTCHCLCGTVSFKCENLISSYNCRCEDCRRCSGSAFAINVIFNKGDVRIIDGRTKSWEKTSGSGKKITRHFCAECGSPLLTETEFSPEVVYVKAGTFDDPSVIKASTQIWLDSKQEWATIPDDLERLAKQR